MNHPQGVLANVLYPSVELTARSRSYSPQIAAKEMVSNIGKIETQRLSKRTFEFIYYERKK
ncbi:hypothetical protein AM460_21330 [Escherichia coli]|uniref:Uncharacterized protein n=1 Tax=Peduovirus P24A7b TaxID=2844219 RepID=A0A653FSE4_9CAUD|nr:hypothetical protein HYP17_gp25 [Peduovirus P24A7b]AVN40498.1 hypothetical protein AM460_21330 [Escherichia coli]EEV9226910.1 hypothetical protein [Escherichia coli]EFO1474850.1 hypothetical protein [Escherichia coli]EHJ7950570.1 hypothetical protein [Escherichia coli]VUD39043.1 hypothetical protein [Peduovirus P24A7b]